MLASALMPVLSLCTSLFFLNLGFKMKFLKHHSILLNQMLYCYYTILCYIFNNASHKPLVHGLMLSHGCRKVEKHWSPAVVKIAGPWTAMQDLQCSKD